MKTAAITALRQKLAANRPAYGLWVTLESPSITEMAVAVGLDYVVIDAEHSCLDWTTIANHLRAATRSPTVAIVRLPEHNTGAIKRALDLGADGIAIPGVETAEQLTQIVRDCRYPLAGQRGVGADRATAWGQAFGEHAATANSHVLVMPILESPRAHANIHELAAVEGAELFYLGPADYSATSGFLGQWEGPGVADELLAMLHAVRSAGKTAGIIGTSHEDLVQRRDQGFRLLGLGTDAILTIRSIRESLRAVNADRIPSASLDPRDSKASVVPLHRVPPEFTPDRRETITARGNGPVLALADGVDCELLVGDFTSARNLSTGIVTFQPGAGLPYHTHPCAESVSVLAGQLDTSVDGRVYRLRPGDNIVVPRWLPHSSRNPLPGTRAVVHVAFAMSVPSRALVTTEFHEWRMPDDSPGRDGAEHVTRLQTAVKYAAGPNTEFVDYFNARIIPGLEMSGGWARFAPGGRLPAHVHDFDESICIVDGTAMCRVNSRRYLVSNCSTACVPRGRPHYFVNESSGLMTMIWVYAGPLPERIVVTDECLFDDA
ncbi:MAG: aldolase/citrate lyase family protein [Planctomycetaceae bacterium]